MDPLTALGLASNVIQIVDFSSRLLSRTREIYRSQDGRIQDHVVLEEAATNLLELVTELQVIPVPKPKEQTAADKQLMQLGTECRGAAQELSNILEQARIQGGNRTWQSIYQAVKSVYSESRIAALQSRLDKIHKQLDTVLLAQLRQNIHKVSLNPKQEAGIEQSVNQESRKRHEELLFAIRKHGWQSGSKRQVAAFSEEFHLVTDVDLEVRFCRAILARLHFQQMNHRSTSIEDAYATTFEWIFHKQSQAQGDASWDSLTEWLQREDDSIYWITGKPGSGKSTLMKYLCSRPLLSELVKKWAKGSKLTQASFYFWNSGVDDMQTSQIGLLQTLLHSFLEKDRPLILSIFKERWEQFYAFGGGIEVFEWTELQSAFNKIISDDSKKFFLLIDGLDEFDGDPKEIIKFVVGTARANVKICTASRPWNQFREAFKNLPNLQLENLTRKDIFHYVNTHFDANEYYLQLKTAEPKNAAKLIDSVVNKASGVFLWVKLVVQSLLQGLSDGDEMSHLRERLNALPSDLEDLFEDILARLEPDYRKHAYQLFRLLQTLRDFYRSNRTRISTGDPTVLELYFADKDDPKGSLRADWRQLEQSDANRKAERMSRRVNARCRGFLEVNGSRETDIAKHRISFIHRTARDFVESKKRWQMVLTLTEDFDPDVHWSDAFLWCLKTGYEKGTKEYREAQLRCILHATHMQNVTNKVQYHYLNETVNIKRSSGIRTLWNFYGHKSVPSQGRKALAAQLTLLLEKASENRRAYYLGKCKEINRELEWGTKIEQYKELRHIMKYYTSLKTLRKFMTKPEVLDYE